jgi:hypothetical protein
VRNVFGDLWMRRQRPHPIHRLVDGRVVDRDPLPLGEHAQRRPLGRREVDVLAGKPADE